MDEYTGGISGYQAEAWRTGSSADDPRDVGESLRRNLALAGMGLAGEAGEVCDLLKKVVFHGKPLDAATRAKLVLEMGDVLWYLAHAATTLGVSLDDVANANAAKLRARFPDGFTRADAAAKRDEVRPTMIFLPPQPEGTDMEALGETVRRIVEGADRAPAP